MTGTASAGTGLRSQPATRSGSGAASQRESAGKMLVRAREAKPIAPCTTAIVWSHSARVLAPSKP